MRVEGLTSLASHGYFVLRARVGAYIELHIWKKLVNIAKVYMALALSVALVACGGSKVNSAATPSGDLAVPTGSVRKVKIGIAKIVQHAALDDIERGIMDEINENAKGLSVDYLLQNANGDVGTAASIASEFLSQKVDVAVGIATPVAVALANKIKDRPVVFGTVTDPIGAGLVTTLEHGEGNVTGTSDAIPSDEHVKLFTQVANIKTLGYIYTSGEANSASSLQLVRKGAKEAGVELIEQSITTSAEVKQAASTIAPRVDGLYLSTDNTVFSGLDALVEVFRAAKKPIFSGDVTGALRGGIFMAWGFNYYKSGRATGAMVLEILGGKDPATIPIGFTKDPKDSDLLIDMDAATNCGIQVSGELLEKANLIYKDGSLEHR